MVTPVRGNLVSVQDYRIEIKLLGPPQFKIRGNGVPGNQESANGVQGNVLKGRPINLERQRILQQVDGLMRQFYLSKNDQENQPQGNGPPAMAPAPLPAQTQSAAGQDKDEPHAVIKNEEINSSAEPSRKRKRSEKSDDGSSPPHNADRNE